MLCRIDRALGSHHIWAIAETGPAQVEKLLSRKSADSIMARRPMVPSDVQAEYMRAVGCFVPSKKVALAHGGGSLYGIGP
jgi:hypothetical protein